MNLEDELRRLHEVNQELLEALKAVHDYLSCIPESSAGGDDEAVNLCRTTSAVILKATGEQK